MNQLTRRELLAGSAALTGAAASAAPAGERPNILHIMTDQQQWSTILGRSECRTPNLDRLARQGMTFERSYTPSAVCCPARAMMLSGSYHWHNGVFNQVHSPPSVHRDMYPDVVLYSQRLRDAGYRLGYTGKWHASFLRTPLDFGFHEVAALNGCDPALLKKLDLNPDRVERRGGLRTTPHRMMQWPGSEPFVMWGAQRGAARKHRGALPRRVRHPHDEPLRPRLAALAPRSAVRDAARSLPAAPAVSRPLRPALDRAARQLPGDLRRQTGAAPPRIRDLGRYHRRRCAPEPRPLLRVHRAGGCADRPHARRARRHRAGGPHAGDVHHRPRRHGRRASHVDQRLDSVRGVLPRPADPALARPHPRRPGVRPPGADARPGPYLRGSGRRQPDAASGRPRLAAALRRPAPRATGAITSCAPITAASTSTRSGSPSPSASSTCSTASISTRCTTCAKTPRSCGT